MTNKIFSIIVPARNEEDQISETLKAIIKAIACFERVDYRSLDISSSRVELIVVDNKSTDGTRKKIDHFVDLHRAKILNCPRLKAPCARNHGALDSNGEILLFVDADTWIPENSLIRVNDLVNKYGYQAGIFRLAPQQRNFRSLCWWTFWNHVRRFPLSKAKALPAFMYCTKATFDTFGPFDERVVIGEEWPILAGLYNANPSHLIYDQTLTAYTSCRRMELQDFGYTKTFLKYVWAILDYNGRVTYSDRFRGQKKEAL